MKETRPGVLIKKVLIVKVQGFEGSNEEGSLSFRCSRLYCLFADRMSSTKNIIQCKATSIKNIWGIQEYF